MNYHNITYPDMNNGDGLRVVLWLSGCSHHCYNCQNPQTWDANSGIPFDESAKKELFRELDKDYISGLTLNGGDPLNEANLDEVLTIIKKFNSKYKLNKSIWIYTGFRWEDIFFSPCLSEHTMKRQEIIRLFNILIDGKYIDSQINIALKWRGSTNHRVINIKESIKQNKVILYCE